MTLKALMGEALAAWKGSPPADLLPEIAYDNKIARVIHQIYFTSPRRPPPAEIQKNIEKIRQANPDWGYRLYDHQDMLDFISAHYGSRVLRYFERINPAYGAAQADLFRYLLLYKTGGVYLDIKSTLSRPLDEILRPDDRYLLVHWRNKQGEEFQGWGLYPEIARSVGEFQQWHIVAAAGHPFLRAVIERVLKNITHYNPVLHGTGKDGVLRVTGPIAYTLGILPQLHLHAHRIGSQEELGFEYSIYPRDVRGRLTRHEGLFKAHYSNLMEPVVRLGVADKILTFALNGLRLARNQFKKA